MGSTLESAFPRENTYIDKLKLYIDNSTNNDIRIVLRGKDIDLVVTDRSLAGPSRIHLSQRTDSLFSRLLGRNADEKILSYDDTAKILQELQNKLFDPHYQASDSQVNEVVSRLFEKLTAKFMEQKESAAQNQQLAAFLLGKAVSNYSEQHGLISLPKIAEEIRSEIVKPREPKSLPVEIGRFAPYVQIEKQTIGQNGIASCLDTLSKACGVTSTKAETETKSYAENLHSTDIQEAVFARKQTLQASITSPNAQLMSRVLGCMSGNTIGNVTKPLLSLLSEAKNRAADLDNPLATTGDGSVSWRFTVTDHEIVVDIRGAVGLRGEKELEIAKELKEKIGKQPLTPKDQQRLKNESYLADIEYGIQITFSRSEPSKEPTVTVQYGAPKFSRHCDPQIKSSLREGYKHAFLR